jgi:WD40 repeat protein
MCCMLCMFCMLSPQAHAGGCCSLSFQPHGHLVASCGMDKTVQTWDLNLNSHVHTYHVSSEPAFELAVNSVAALDGTCTPVKQMDTPQPAVSSDTRPGNTRCYCSQRAGARLQADSWVTVSKWEQFRLECR